MRLGRKKPTPIIEETEVMMTPTLIFGSTERKQKAHRTVMDVEPCCSDDVVLVNRDEIGAIEEAYRIPMQTWEDMGSPGKMTVTIEPGDLLNGVGS